MSFEMHDVNMMAAGASTQALNYITEVLGFVEGEPVPDDAHQVFVVAMIETIALMEVQLRKNLKNPESWAAARASIEQLVEKISEKLVDRPKKPGIIIGK